MPGFTNQFQSHQVDRSKRCLEYRLREPA